MDVKYDPLSGCPVCGSINTESDMEVVDQYVLHWNMVCNDCNFWWYDVYEYTRSMAVYSDDDDDELYLADEEEE